MFSLVHLSVAITAIAVVPPRPIALKLSDEVVARGERLKVKVKTAADGYLVVLRADALGRVRVLFPIDPTDSARVQGGREFAIRGRGDRDGFMVDSREGSGIVLAAVSAAPFNFQEFTRGVHWDYRALAAADSGADSTADPEAVLFSVVDRMSGGDYEYDVASYSVSDRAYNRRHAGWGWHGGWGGWGGWGWPRRCVRCGWYVRLAL